MQSSSLSIRLYNRLKENTLLFVYFPLTLYWILLFTVTTIPADAIPQIFSSQDKIEHFAAYFLLALLLNLSLHFQRKHSTISDKSLFLTFGFIIIYAALDELHQIFIPGRYCDIYDFIADTLGGILGVFLVAIFLKRVNSLVQAKIHSENGN